MKVAIVGGGPGGLLASWEFHQLGAEVVLFGEGELGGGIRRLQETEMGLSMGRPWGELLPASLQAVKNRDSRPTAGEYWREGIAPLGGKNVIPCSAQKGTSRSHSQKFSRGR